MKSAIELVSVGCRPSKVSQGLQIARSTLYRHLRPKTAAEALEKPRPAPVNKIPIDIRTQIMDILHEERFVDLTPLEIVPTLADEGLYLASSRTFYRILREEEESCERRLQARRIKHSAPILEADAPNKVWSWDITRIEGPHRGEHYFLYVMIDIYSRFVTGWMLARRENSTRAQNFIRETVMKHSPSGGITIHNDRGSPMIAGRTRELMRLLGVEQSFSRPRTSDDNPFSEACFKTIKYHHAFPGFFASIAEAEQWLENWFDWYNWQHRHTGINLHTPGSVHYGCVNEVMEARQRVMDAAYEAHPERFANGRPIVKSNPSVVGINLRLKSVRIEECLQQEMTA